MIISIKSNKIYDKETKDAIYRVIDEFSLFYLKFMEKADRDTNWARISEGASCKIWGGMAFESICLKHIGQIKAGLGITDRLFLTLITTYGVKENSHMTALVKKNLTMDVLFN